MKYRPFLGKEISQLGFGCMRLPSNPETRQIDFAETEKLFMHAIEKGVNYFDSAYIYHGGQSEVVIGEIFEKHGVRSKINLATKLPTMGDFPQQDFNKLFDDQLKRFRTDYIDFYLLHDISRTKWDLLKSKGIIDFMQKIKNDGLIRYQGFSCHDDTEGFKYIIDSYDWDFCQIQYNFMDADIQAGTEGLEYSASKNIPVVIMEPLKGGQLISIDEEEVKELKASHSVTDKSMAQLAVGFIMSRPEVLTMLSGMNTMDQLTENIATASAVGPGGQPANEAAFLVELKKTLESKDLIPCTKCRYCTSGCPAEINIPGVFENYNESVMFNSKTASANALRFFNRNAFDCTECGQCEEACPQHLHIPELIKSTIEYLGASNA